MKNLEPLQVEIFKNYKIAQAELDKMILKLQAELKDHSILSLLQINMLRADISRIHHIKRQLRDLELNHYRKDGIIFPES